MAKEIKTNVMRILDKEKISYQAHFYEHNDDEPFAQGKARAPAKKQCRHNSGSIPDTAIGGIAELPSQPVNSGRHFFHWPPNLWVRPLTPNYPDEAIDSDSSRKVIKE